MVIKNYCMSLEEEIVDKAKMIFYEKSQKLSPIVNQFLKELVEKEESKEWANGLFYYL